MNKSIHIHDLLKIRQFELELIVYCYKNDKIPFLLLMFNYLFNRKKFYCLVSEKISIDIKNIPMISDISEVDLSKLEIYSPYHYKFNEKLSDSLNVEIKFTEKKSKPSRVKIDRETVSTKIKSIVSLMRIEQWVKCILVLAPLVFAHEFSNLEAWKNSVVGMFLFCLMASSVYMLNDLFDVWDDRRNQEKRNRPLANCSISVFELMTLFFIIQTIVLALGLTLNFSGISILYIYLLLNVIYSFKVKVYFVLDVIMLTSFYMIRIVFGAVVANVIVSDWLIIFSFFIFLSLSFLKRFTELSNNYKYAGNSRLSARDYSLIDQPIVLNAGITSGITSAFVLGLYIKFGSVGVSYSNDKYLWGIAVVVLYWILYMWMKALRGIIKYDPVKFAIRDGNSWVALIIILILGVIAI